ncbi:hypothetical protein CGMCC3_g9512 [Colletotrichum fructicola]|uniref:FAD dependent oxidoreductase, putative n=1 Tax=Colletotrichum fructicola (strain Nara gc5) TaxID=1213859 RepID=L2G4V1_COLFN|nr:uncharacterized protein CGMCC3_g9512 [Colletotrichum fructicola]KAE9574251.1 hypothetical protein CGMCC3_g9512 [Colletotrichum fructicola]KAF4431603.1 FAD-dependent monooxygenase nscC [Colletotrichum fructicola]KAF4474443.1 hypothetical protein CGGC5_v016597 [Colletotrichum fructicola Nara gc5]
MASFKVIIIGSGLAGSLLANGLARHNIEFEVYERAEKHSKREGFQIRLGEGALIGMRACLEQEQIDSIARRFARSTVSNPPIVYDKHFNKMFEPGKMPGYQRSTPINRVSLREAFSEPLYKMGKLHNEKRLTNYEIRGDGSRRFVKAFFDDDTSDTCDVLIGADGSGSKVNCLLGLNNLEEVSSYYGFLARKDFPVSVFNDIPRQLHSPVGTIDDGATLFFQVYLPREVGNAADSKHSSEQGISTMLGIGWHRDRMPQEFDALTTEKKWDAAELLIRDWSPQHHQIFNMFRGQDMYCWTPRVSSRPPLDWRRAVASPDDERLGNPHVWLIGDAMHAMLPSRGMGGNQSMLDTADALPLLTRLAEKARTANGASEQDFIEALHAYEGAVIPRAFEWVRQSGGNDPLAADTSKFKARAIMRLLSFIGEASTFWNWVVFKITGVDNSKQAIDLL